ncbi:MAG: hypothetical protein AVDCRST_MAG42-328 [uncultured Chthoniobacterales bacterium]|uniref:Protein BatD n=1 Tax=uncultured Chthoniobacterales bacterium TaxID=1836801 RepID=A0A6J4H7W5_9BACT|nr:MAG: hypothetical protein AVDCRST_MAG42-328 [uncultured Chthoniobacterales bacterium]
MIGKPMTRALAPTASNSAPHVTPLDSPPRVIPSEVEESRGATGGWSRGIPPLRFASVGMTVWLVLALFLSAPVALAQQPSVTAVLDSSETGLGNPVQLQIVVTGASNPKPPGEINVDGLDIRSAGVSRQYQMQNFSVSYSFTYNYTIMPLRTGTFTIPPQTVEVAGRAMKTPALSLNVVDSPGRSSRRGGGRDDAGAVDPAKIGFIEMVLPKQVAYVGEMIPVQIRLGLNMRAPVDSLGSGMQIAGQGFTTQKMPEPRQTIETINGRSYQVFIFKTAISPVRAGKLEIGPAEIKPVVRVPRGGPRSPTLPRSLFDDPSDPLNQLLNDPFLSPSVPKEINLKSQATTVEVKPLPPNAPPTFGGAVGTFAMKSDANPKKVQVGDPITVTAAIIGRGNFDRVTAPVLENEAGWHKYPPSDKFSQDDDVGISGTKTFETVVSPKERKDKMPPLVFTFFDPVKETYVSLRSADLPLRVEGGAAPTATPAAAAAAPQTATPAIAPTPTPAPQERDILYQLSERPTARQTFAPLHARPAFWLAQLVPLSALAGLVAWRMRQRRLANRDAQRTADLQHQAAELERRLRANGAAPREYLADASRTVQLKTALAKNVDPNLVDAETAATAFRLDEQQSAQLRQLFEQSDELRYSGSRNGGHTISPENQREILELVENLRA